MRHDEASILVREVVGHNIRDLRKAGNISQAAFALMINSDRSFISCVESGKANFSMDFLTKVASGLDCEMPDFFRGLEGASPERLAERLVQYGGIDLSQHGANSEENTRRLYQP